MTSTPPLEIKVIYSASARGPRRVKTGGAAGIATVSQSSRTRAWATLGLMNLVVAAILCYAIWWRVDPYIYVTMVMRTPVSVQGVDLGDAALMFGISPGAPATPAKPSGDAESPSLAPVEPEQIQRYQGEMARNVIVASGYTWLTLATIACAMVALAGGASLGRAGGRPVRLVGAIAVCVGLMALVYVGYQVWAEYGRQFRPTTLRTGMSLIVLLTAFAGMVLARGARKLTRWSAALLILSAAGSVVGIYLGAHAGAIPLERSNFTFLAMTFVIHSLYGWILLPVASRIAR